MHREVRNCLIEAARRRIRFNHLKQPITKQWTGLGTYRWYRRACEEGYMVRVYPNNTVNPRHAQWFRLTPKGARVVMRWLNDGLTLANIEIPDQHILDSLE